MGMGDWHANILLELLKLSREGYLSSISHDVEVVTGKKPISFSQFAKGYIHQLSNIYELRHIHIRQI